MGSQKTEKQLAKQIKVKIKVKTRELNLALNLYLNLSPGGAGARSGTSRATKGPDTIEWAPWWGRTSRTANCCVCGSRGPGAAFADRHWLATRPVPPLRTRLQSYTYSYTTSYTPISPPIFEDKDEDDGTTRSYRQTVRLRVGD